MERNRSKTMKVISAECLYLPDDCWEHVFTFLKDSEDDYHHNPCLKSMSLCDKNLFSIIDSDDYDEYDHNRNLKSLSVVSKQFFSITNRLRLSLTVYDPTLPFLSRLFHRFTNLTSLDLTHFPGDLDLLLRQISLFPLKLTSLNLSHKTIIIPANGLRAFSQNITTLTSLICSNLPSFTSNHLFLVAECFPLLQELDLSDPILKIKDYHCNKSSFLDGVEALSLSLSKLRKINLSSHLYINDKSIFHLFNNCKLLQEVILPHCHEITKEGVASALSEKQSTLRYLSLPLFRAAQVINSLLSLKGLTYIDMKFSTISDALLTSIAMEGLPLKRIGIGYCKGYTYTGLFTLLSKCQSIQYLDLQFTEFLNDLHVVDLSLYLVGLVSVNLSLCRMVTESSLFVLVRKCPSLSQIIMIGIAVKSIQNYDYLMDFGVYPQLQSLNMSNHLWLGDESIKMFASAFPNLHRLDLNSCIKISDEGIVHVLRTCRKISHLNLSSSWLKLLGMNYELPKLKVLNLSGSKADDETLYSISNNCCGLLQLFLNSCYVCTEKGVKHVVEKCTQLREIHLRYCFHFSESERKLFLRRGCVVC
ncbi:uncharacterized protein LOC131615000 [Vicia villosa]|uniref:uncharacterized protein LOC131615000 n=1 Tax=Vicia villosa TaxID=3911 RepID=UPI00273CA529|nr:uncharacterized protein LOC131615000 [Vicia villosa]